MTFPDVGWLEVSRHFPSSVVRRRAGGARIRVLLSADAPWLLQGDSGLDNRVVAPLGIQRQHAAGDRARRKPMGR